jgi:hypothetical protein
MYSKQLIYMCLHVVLGSNVHVPQYLKSKLKKKHKFFYYPKVSVPYTYRRYGFLTCTYIHKINAHTHTEPGIDHRPSVLLAIIRQCQFSAHYLGDHSTKYISGPKLKKTIIPQSAYQPLILERSLEYIGSCCHLQAIIQQCTS